MNKENEKKWFIHVVDHHEGPFSVTELREMKNAGKVHAEVFSWADGMADWLPISQIKDLHDPLFQVAPVISPVTEEKEPTSTNIQTSRAINRGKLAGIAVSSLVVGSFLFLVILSRVSSEGLHSKLRPLLTRICDSVPLMTNVFHLVPSLNDVRPEEIKELEQARAETLESGARIAVALSINDPNRPYFYISTNLPDQTRFDIYLSGNSETLLNKLQYNTQANVITRKGFGRSEVFLADGGQPIPKGEYQVFVVEANDQDEPVRVALNQLTITRPAGIKTPSQVPAVTRFLISKTYFLGGDRNDTYLTRLKSFHEKVKANAEHEVLELKQYTDTLSLQYSTLSTEFNQLFNSKKTGTALKAGWKRDSETWTKINSQLDQTIQTWSPETLENEFFYGKVYGLVKSAYSSIKSLFNLESSYIENPSDRGAFEIEHGKAMSEAREALEILRKKVDLVLNAPKTQSGLPTREGL